jgi:membrane protein insertase Oxa1/YidC/SpoIIIJ
MMLFMFYNFASALSLYWTVSQGLSILQMWLIRRSVAKKEAENAATGTIIDPPSTRQMKRHG